MYRPLGQLLGGTSLPPGYLYFLLGSIVLLFIVFKSRLLGVEPIGLLSHFETLQLSLARALIENNSGGDAYLASMRSLAELSDTPIAKIPWNSYWLSLIWAVSGGSIFTMRLSVVLLSSLAVPLVYLAGYRASGSRTLGLFSALFFSLMPLNLFFGRHLSDFYFGQLLVLALLALLAGLDSGKSKKELLGCSFVLLLLASHSFPVFLACLLMSLVAVFFLFNLANSSDARRETLLYLLLPTLAGTLVLGLGFFVFGESQRLGALFSGINEITLGQFLFPEFWQQSNFTNFFYRDLLVRNLGLFIAVPGLIGIAGVVWGKLGNQKIRYLVAAGILAWLFFNLVFPEQSLFFNYWQLPFVWIAAFGAAALLEMILAKARSWGKWYPAACFLALTCLIAATGFLSWRQLGFTIESVYPGTDLAGKRIAELSEQEDSLMLYSHENQLSLCYYARIPCYKIPENPVEFAEAIERIDPDFLLVGGFGYDRFFQQLSFTPLLLDNFGFIEMGLIELAPGQNIPSYFILKRDEGMTIEALGRQTPQEPEDYSLAGNTIEIVRYAAPGYE